MSRDRPPGAASDGGHPGSRGPLSLRVVGLGDSHTSDEGKGRLGQPPWAWRCSAVCVLWVEVRAGKRMFLK